MMSRRRIAALIVAMSLIVLSGCARAQQTSPIAPPEPIDRESSVTLRLEETHAFRFPRGCEAHTFTPRLAVGRQLIAAEARCSQGNGRPVTRVFIYDLQTSRLSRTLDFNRDLSGSFQRTGFQFTADDTLLFIDEMRTADHRDGSTDPAASSLLRVARVSQHSGASPQILEVYHRDSEPLILTPSSWLVTPGQALVIPLLRASTQPERRDIRPEDEFLVYDLRGADIMPHAATGEDDLPWCPAEAGCRVRQILPIGPRRLLLSHTIWGDFGRVHGPSAFSLVEFSPDWTEQTLLAQATDRRAAEGVIFAPVAAGDSFVAVLNRSSETDHLLVSYDLTTLTRQASALPHLGVRTRLRHFIRGLAPAPSSSHFLLLSGSGELEARRAIDLVVEARTSMSERFSGDIFNRMIPGRGPDEIVVLGLEGIKVFRVQMESQDG